MPHLLTFTIYPTSTTEITGVYSNPPWRETNVFYVLFLLVNLVFIPILVHSQVVFIRFEQNIRHWFECNFCNYFSKVLTFDSEWHALQMWTTKPSSNWCQENIEIWKNVVMYYCWPSWNELSPVWLDRIPHVYKFTSKRKFFTRITCLPTCKATLCVCFVLYINSCNSRDRIISHEICAWQLHVISVCLTIASPDKLAILFHIARDTINVDICKIT